MITYRKMTISDYEQVQALWLSCKGMGLNDLDDSPEGIARYLDRNPDTCFVAETNNSIVGVILSGHDGRRGFIYHTAVAPEYRGQGIATALVDLTVTALKNCGINKIALVVFDHNEAGNTFWEKMGFTAREDLVYRNRAVTQMVRIDT